MIYVHEGGTFSGIGSKIKELVPNANVNLVVTHCEENVKNGDFKNKVDKIIVVSDSILKEVPENLKDILTIKHRDR